jgi:hypothetical protein
MNKQVFSKVFRWYLPKEQTQLPTRVEVAGTFTDWQTMPMKRDNITGCWQLALHEIAGNRTHHYMVLADGKPVQDRHCDGLTMPQGPDEERFAITTVRGPRVFMLFSQTK